MEPTQEAICKCRVQQAFGDEILMSAEFCLNQYIRWLQQVPSEEGGRKEKKKKKKRLSRSQTQCAESGAGQTHSDSLAPNRSTCRCLAAAQTAEPSQCVCVCECVCLCVCVCETKAVKSPQSLNHFNQIIPHLCCFFLFLPLSFMSVVGGRLSDRWGRCDLAKKKKRRGV